MKITVVFCMLLIFLPVLAVTFRDDFDDNDLGRWKILVNNGNVKIGNGIVKINDSNFRLTTGITFNSESNYHRGFRSLYSKGDSTMIQKTLFMTIFSVTISILTFAALEVDFKFEEVAKEAGIDRETKGGSQFSVDMDDDGWQDVLLGNYKGEINFYQNQGDGTYENISDKVGLTQITKEIGMQGYNIAPVDFDYDVDIDLVGGTDPGVVQPGGSIIFLENENGKFKNVSDKVEGIGVRMMAAVYIADFNIDGLIDLILKDFFAANFPRGKLYLSEGGLKFRDITNQSNIDFSRANSINVFDYNSDRLPDIFMTNENGHILYKNNGDESFSDVSQTMGINGKGIPSLNADIEDYNNDGLLDILVQTNSKVYLYQQNKDLSFSEVGDATQINQAVVNREGWVISADCNNDGWTDILFTGDSSTVAHPSLLLNNQDGTFSDVSEETGLNKIRINSGFQIVSCLTDIDNNGTQDFFSPWWNGPKSLLLKNSGNNNHYIKLSIKGKDGYTVCVTLKDSNDMD